jgi:hypothetical protein
VTLRSILTRTATITLAAAALAAPTALARPADTPPAYAAAMQEQDLRSADATDAATRPALGSQSDTPAATTPTTAVDRGINWATIAIGIAGSLLAIGTIALIAGRTRRTARARTTA